MVADDVVYVCVTTASVASGPLFREVVKDPGARRWCSSLLGLLLLWVTCGNHIIHLLITIAGNCILLIIVPPSKNKSNLPGKSFLWNFGYLAIFRTVHWLGIPAPTPVTNAAQLFLTLRMVGLAFEIQDSYSRKTSPENPSDADAAELQLKIKYCSIDVKTTDVVHYALCYIGMLTGPYYKYRTYEDWIHLSSKANLDWKEPFLSRIKQLPAIAISYLFFSYFFSIQYVENDEFLERSFLYRLLYMVPMFIIFRTRLYLAWILSECMSMTAGLGAYPVRSKPRCGEGPTDYKELLIAYKEETDKPCAYSFETIHNIDIYGCELAPTTKQGLRSWNMTVQYWLASYVHRRVPPTLKAHRVAITMTVSAFWHGIHPGYYLSFLTVPPILMAEEAMIKAFREGASSTGQKVFDWGCWFFKMRGFDYMCMGFLLLKLGSTLRYWYAIYFMGHIVMLIFLVLGNIGIALKQKCVKAKQN